MPFPEAKRIIYRKNPLDQVICQLRFPSILKIDADVPAEFQDRIRGDFPNLSESFEIKVEIPHGIKAEIPPELIKQALQSSGVKNYEFSSEDGTCKVNLTRAFIALSTNKYERWELFKDKLVKPLEALIDIYAPTYFTRVGLRYRDIIRRSSLGLDNVSWTDLLKPHFLGLLGSPTMVNNIDSFENRYDIRLSDSESKVKVVMNFVEPAGSDEKCYVIDSDFYSNKKLNIGEAKDKLDYFHVRASRLIQWCITETLHNAMEPEEL